MFEGETLLDTIPYTPAPSIVLTGLMRIRPIHDFQTGFPTHPVGPPHSARFRASRVVHYLEILRISNSPETHGRLAGTDHQIATADRAEDGALLAPTL